MFGRGPADARLVFIGDQPAADDDQHGEPFVGPAGRLFDALLADAGIDRQAVYFTNVVKHFPCRAGSRRGPNRYAALRCVNCAPAALGGKPNWRRSVPR